MSRHIAENLSNLPTGARDLGYLMLGESLGRGISREVYQCNANSDYVVKYEFGDEYQNIIEWEIWNNIKGCKRVSKWFAPCVDISPNGHFLVQEKVNQYDRSKYPKKIPAFFKDVKYENFGFIGKRFVCCDYGTFLRADTLHKTFKDKLVNFTWQ